METLTIKQQTKSLHFGSWDIDKEIEVFIRTGDNDSEVVWISPNEANEIVAHLIEQLKSIGEWEPVSKS